MDTTKPVLFNMKGLSASGIARIEQSVKNAKDTLALADKLQAVRDDTRSFMKTYDQLKRTTTLSRTGSQIDFSL